MPNIEGKTIAFNLPMALRVLAFLLLSLLVSCQLNYYNATKYISNGVQPKLCPSHCRKFNSSSNIFSNENDMAKHFVKSLIASKSLSDIVASFGNYSQSFISKQMLNLQSLQALEQYTIKVLNKYGVDAFQEAISQRYAGGIICPDCVDNLQQEGSSGVPFTQFNLSPLSDDINEEFNRSPVLLAVDGYPYFGSNLGNRRLLPPRFHPSNICLNNSWNALAQLNCWYNGLVQSAQQEIIEVVRPSPYPIIIPADTGNAERHEQTVPIWKDWENEIPEEQVAGFAQIIINSMNYRDALVTSMNNCNQGVFLTTCK